MKRITLTLLAGLLATTMLVSPAPGQGQDNKPAAVKENDSLKLEIESLKKENEALRRENQQLRKLLADRPPAATTPAATAPATPLRSVQPTPSIAAPQSGASRTLDYWLTSSSSKRHNSTCRYYGTSKGRPCGQNDGVACKICGG